MRALPTRKLDKRITRVWRLSALFNVLLWSLVIIGTLAIVWATVSSAAAGGGATGAAGAVGSAGDGDAGARTASFVLGIIVLALLVLAGVALVFFVVIVPKIRWIQWSFEVFEEEIDIHKGIFWRKRIIIPLIRVQNVDTRQGPIMRAHGLASFTVATAAGEHAIPGLDYAEADALRDRVAVLARLAQEDV